MGDSDLKIVQESPLLVVITEAERRGLFPAQALESTTSNYLLTMETGVSLALELLWLWLGFFLFPRLRANFPTAKLRKIREVPLR